MSLERMENNVKDWLPGSFEETKELTWFAKHFVGEQSFILLTWEGCSDKDESFKLPSVVTLGLSYRPEKLQFESGGLLLGVDLSKPVDNRLRIHLGGEWHLQDLVALRTGYGIGYDERGLAAGLGLHQGRWTIDYAWVPYSSDLGDTHRISLGIDL